VSTDGNMPAEVPRSSAPVGLGTHSARGLVYLFAGSTATKAISFVSQIILLYLLGRKDFGVVILANTITEFILIIGQAGVGDVLVRRRAFKQWSVPGFWLSLVLGLVSGLAIAASAPIAAWVYGDSPQIRGQLFWVLMVLAPSPVFYALSVVPRAQISKQLRFRALATVNLTEVALINILTVVFAALGFGPFSFVLPAPVGGLVMTCFLWWWVRPHWSPQLRLRRWRYLVGDSSHLLFGEFGRKIVDQSDFITLGLFRTVDVVGLYGVGFRFSLQMVRLLMVNMTSILFPAFTKLNDQPQQQYQGFLRAQRIMALVGVSSCLLQAAIAEPFAHLLFPVEWWPSIIVMQILSLGMSTRMIAGASYALLKSQGHFRTIAINFWCCAIAQVALLVAVLATGGGIVGVAIVVSLVSSVTGPITFYLAVQEYGGGWADVAHVLTRPLVSGVFSVGVAWLIAEWLKSQGYGPLVQFIEIVLVAVTINALLAWLWMRPVWDDFWLRIRRLLPARAVA
jgi:PST family polysaccharide transporter